MPEVFRRAGLEVQESRKLGDNPITSGCAMGFGVGDFEGFYLASHLVSSFSSLTTHAPARSWERAEQDLHMGTALLLHRPAGIVGTAPSSTAPGPLRGVHADVTGLP